MSNVQPESLQANVVVDREKLVAQVIAFGAKKQAEGFTADETVENYGETALHNNYAPRITELWLSDLIVRTTRRRKTRSGNNARVHVLPSFATPEEIAYSNEQKEKRLAKA